MLTKLNNFINNHYFTILIVFLIILNLAPFLAPIFAHIGWKGPSKFIYTIYSFFCHQLHWRSLHIYDYQCAWCTRDTFIWGAILAVALIVKFYKVKTIRWYWVLPFVIPIALDGGIQTIATIMGYDDEDPFYMSTNTMRMLTGGLFGTGLGLWLMPLLKESAEITNS